MLTKKHLLGYTLGDLGECITFSIMGSFLTRYYVNVAMIDMAVLSLITFVWKVWDAASNPLVGMFLDKMYDKHHYKDGKFRHWMLRSAPLLAITAILTFTAPSWVDGMSKLVVVFTTYLLYQLAYSLFNIPYGSLLTPMSNTDEERAKLSSARGIGGMMGNMIPLSLFPLVIAAFEKNPQLGYSAGITVCAAVGFILCLLSYRFTEERFQSEPAGEQQSATLTDIKNTFTRNKAYLAMCIHGICQGMLMAVSQVLGTYMYADVFGNLAIMSMANLFVLPLSILVLVISPKLTKKMGMVTLIRRSLVLGSAIMAGLFVLHVTTDISVWVHMILSAMGSAMLSVGNMMQWGLVSQAIRHNETLLGVRLEGTLYGTFNMLRRLGQAISASACVALLGAIGYDAAVSNQGLPQTDGVVLGIRILCVLMPAVLSMGSWVAFRFVWNTEE